MVLVILPPVKPREGEDGRTAPKTTASGFRGRAGVETGRPGRGGRARRAGGRLRRRLTRIILIPVAVGDRFGHACGIRQGAGLVSGPDKPVVVCTAPPFLYAIGHIPGAVLHGPASSPEGLDSLKRWADALPRNTNVVIYCGCCPLAACPNLARLTGRSRASVSRACGCCSSKTISRRLGRSRVSGRALDMGADRGGGRA